MSSRTLLGILTIGLSSSTLSTAVTEGTVMGYNEEAGTTGRSVIDIVAIPVFSVLLKLINLVKEFSPIDALSTGRSITWGQLGLAIGQIVFLLCGLVGLVGIIIFNRRELATAQGTQ